MTFSTVSASACEVDEVAATAAGIVGLRAGGGGSVACWRLAASIPAGAIASGAVFLLAVFALGLLLGFALGLRFGFSALELWPARSLRDGPAFVRRSL